MRKVEKRPKRCREVFEPASSIIRALGGHVKASEITGKAVLTVYRWTYSTADGGTGGHIPPKPAKRIYEWAKQNGVKIPAEKFFDFAA
jgi:hypothetical protein